MKYSGSIPMKTVAKDVTAKAVHIAGLIESRVRSAGSRMNMALPIFM
jgi:hypothetical protein